MSPNTISFVRLDYDSPAGNIAGCVGIGVGGEPTRHARELVARRAVLFADTAARRTLPGRVARVNELNRHTEKPAFVFDLREQVSEGPRVQDAALRFSSPYPVAYSLHRPTVNGGIADG